jgi:hypothetical protein
LDQLAEELDKVRKQAEQRKRDESSSKSQ